MCGTPDVHSPNQRIEPMAVVRDYVSVGAPLIRKALGKSPGPRTKPIHAEKSPRDTVRGHQVHRWH